MPERKNCRIGYRRVKAVTGGEWIADFTADNRKRHNEMVDVLVPITLVEAYAICRAWTKAMRGGWLYFPVWLYEDGTGRICYAPIGELQMPPGYKAL